MKQKIIICSLSFLFLITLLIQYHTTYGGESITGEESSRKRFSLKLRETEVVDVLRLLSHEFGFNVILPPDIRGKITVDFDNVTLDEAMNAVLHSVELSYIKEGSIIRVDKKEKLDKEYNEMVRREASKLKLEPLVTRRVELNYISKTGTYGKKGGDNALLNFKKAIESMLSDRKGASITLVESTQTLIVIDVEESVENIVDMVRELDIPTPQVRIEVRMVEIEDRDSLDMGISWGGTYSKESGLDFPGKVDVTGDANNDVVSLPSSVLTGGTINLALGGLNDALNLDLTLHALEQKRRAKVLSKPSIRVIQNQNAEIHVGSEVPIIKGRDLQTGELIISYEKIGVRLNIVPQITKENKVFMSVKVEKSEKGDQWEIGSEIYDTISTKNASTQLLAIDGETSVIGGLYSKSESDSKSSVPFFSKIPILGFFFRSKSATNISRELLIFLTPHIIRLE